VARKQLEHTGSDGVARLVDAERAWERSLEAARAAATDAIQAARAEAARIDDATTAEIALAIEARRRELGASTARAVAELGAEFATRTARYAQASEAMVGAAAAIVADAAPWLAPSVART
jgi:hypothetical protein